MGWRPRPIQAAAIVLAGTLCFHLAMAFPGPQAILLIGGGWIPALLTLRLANTARQAFYPGVLAGFSVFVPYTLFFWQLFPWVAVVLWALLALWHGIFAAALRGVHRRYGNGWGLIAAPFLWTGLEYLRAEVWPLRFTWLTLGSAAGHAPAVWPVMGVYGWSFLGVAIGAALIGPVLNPGKLGSRLFALAALGFLAISPYLSHRPAPPPAHRHVKIAGLQLEFPSTPEVIGALGESLETHPDTELFVLSEYTFTGEVPESIRQWCQRHRRWMVVGGRAPAVTEPTPTTWSLLAHGTFKTTQDFRNTVYVVDTNGAVVFTQAKSQPIQFLDDGLPASKQTLWESPWGRIGIAICYDASYRRVMDRLVALGAEALILPAMDVVEWGATEHRMNALQSELRALEYRIPIVRVASSGISQYLPVDATGLKTPIGAGNILFCDLLIPDSPKTYIPWDRYGAPSCSVLACLIILSLTFRYPSRVP
jgi:apolipoprotein N-acyltransferase